jgi:glycosyltransferase involved in cell wall biosynthesis
VNEPKRDRSVIDPESMVLSILLPVYNERSTILEILKRVSEVEWKLDIVVVDDGSDDGTVEILKGIDREDVRVFYHDRNMGKGAAVQTGLRHVRGDVVIVQDADLEYDPREYPKILEPILDGRADAVYGSRFLGGPHRVLLFWHYMGNRFLTFVSNLLNNINLTDMETCYKAFRVDVFDTIRIRSRRFGFEPEVTAKLARNRFRIYEVPISYSGRDYGEGKKITWRDGLAAIYWILRYRLFD